MTATSFALSPQTRLLAMRAVEHSPEGYLFDLRPPEKDRTARQNRTIHKWFSQIAVQSPGLTEPEVKAQCNLTYGLPIMMRDDPDWGKAFGYIFADLSYPAKLKAIRVLDIPFTRRMKVGQLSEYMEAMQRDYREAGFSLIDPEARKYEGAA
ncbi:hypothetical protein [Dinoroseobacter sp. S124A]|uniref:hypothetical protein n=1 Tax=Dinoroseobacter sp. S124A TaxID=3415128 RepID=UPI003C7BEA49